MKITAALCFFSLALAAPGPLEKRLPSHTPVNVKNLDFDFDFKCGKTTIKGKSVLNAVSWGTNLERAGDTLGANNYPHRYRNNGADKRFNFLSDDCNKDPQPDRKEFPITAEGTFDGDNDQPGRFRAIYLHDPSSQADIQGNPTSIYCGTIYHPSRNGDFEGCDVVKN